MPFVKGESGNKAGKPKGTVSKKTALKDLLNDAFVRNEKKAKAMLDEMFNDKKDFKWISEVKASLEPKAIEHTGEQGGPIRVIYRAAADKA